MTLRSSVEELEGLPLINLRESPMVGWAAVQKRGFDMVVASFLLVGLAPLLALAALAVWPAPASRSSTARSAWASTAASSAW